MTAALVAIFCLILGVVCGLLFGRATNAPYQEAQSLKDSLEQVQSEYDAYKSEVTQHFTKTAELVNSMTDNYRNVHTHLASGAQTLCTGALQLESMNDKEALEAQAEEVAEPVTTEEPTTETATAEASPNDSTVNEEVIEVAATSTETETDSKVEQIKVDAGTVKVEEATDVEAKSGEGVPAELLADAAATEQKQSEGRVH